MAEVFDQIRVQGLREFQAKLKAADGESQKLLRVVLNDAAEIVVKEANSLVPRRTGNAAASIKAQSSQREGRVRAGGAKVPYYAWLDFGGRVGRSRSVVRPFMKSGRYIYPAAQDKRDAVADRLEESMTELAKKVGLI
jgi:hypothetical protein